MRVSLSPSIQDDMLVRVFNYNTLEKVHSFEAHTDYIRSIIVHPTHPYILTASGKCCPVPFSNHTHTHQRETVLDLAKKLKETPPRVSIHGGKWLKQGDKHLKLPLDL